MTDAVHVHCPNCRNTLRIPVDWADRPMRCKFCRQVFMAHRKGASIAAPPTLRPGQARSLKPTFVAALVLSGAAGAVLGVGIFLGPALRTALKSPAPAQTAKAAEQNPPAVTVLTRMNPAPGTRRGQTRGRCGPFDSGSETACA